MSANYEQTTIHAADLAELIVDEISAAGQDWRAIELHARELVEILARRASVQAAAHGGLHHRDPPTRISPCRSPAVARGRAPRRSVRQALTQFSRMDR